MTYKLTILGSGTCVPDFQRFPAAYLVEAYIMDERWLVDLGVGALLRLAEIGLSPFDIDRVFLTHTHPDHIAAFLPLLQALNYTPERKREKMLRFYCSREVAAMCKSLIHLDSKMNPKFPHEFVEIASNQTVALTDAITVFALEVKHSAPTLGFRFRFNLDGKTLVFGGDSGMCDNLIALCDRADLAVLDCSFPEGRGTSSHASTDEIGRMSHMALPKRIVLSHMYPELVSLPPAEIKQQVQNAGYAGDIVISFDKCSITI